MCDALCAPDSDSFDADPGALLVVGCDSMLEINGAMQGKPHTPEVARERIRAMRGTTATLWTGHSVALLTPRSSSDRAGSGSRTAAARLTRSASTQVHFGQITDAEIDAYVATGEPLRRLLHGRRPGRPIYRRGHRRLSFRGRHLLAAAALDGHGDGCLLARPVGYPAPLSLTADARAP